MTTLSTGVVSVAAAASFTLRFSARGHMESTGWADLAVAILAEGDVSRDGEVSDAEAGLTLPEVAPRAGRGLKFAEALPPRLAEATLAARLTDAEGARTALAEPVRFVRGTAP